MAKVTNKSEKTFHFGKHQLAPKESAEVPDEELEQAKQNPDLAKAFKDGTLHEEPSQQGVGGAGAGQPKAGTQPGQPGKEQR